MAVVYERMLVDRSALWALVAAAVADMLRCLAMPAAMPFDDFLAVLWAVSTIVNLGREFCGAESKSLLDALHMKVREYLQNTHAESFQVLRQMVESEAWRCVPIALEEMGGVLGVIKQTLPPVLKPPPQPHMASSLHNNSNNHHNDIAAAAESSMITSDGQIQSQGGPDAVKSSSSTGSSSSSSILMSFAVCGNPLRLHPDDPSATTSEEDTEEKEEDDEGHHVEEVGSGSTTVASNGNGHSRNHVNTSSSSSSSSINSVLSLSSSLAVEYECFVEMLSKEEGKRNTPSLQQQSTANNKQNHKPTANPSTSTSSAAVCVTQTLLNGLARYSGRYLQKMHLLPSTAAEVFSSLCQLFDYYLCAVFRGFVGNEERQWLANRYSRLSSSAPDQGDEFEVVCAYMERVQLETVLLSPSQHRHLGESLALLAQQAQEVQDAREKQQWDNATGGKRISVIANAFASSMSAAAAAAEAAIAQSSTSISSSSISSSVAPLSSSLAYQQEQGPGVGASSSSQALSLGQGTFVSGGVVDNNGYPHNSSSSSNTQQHSGLSSGNAILGVGGTTISSNGNGAAAAGDNRSLDNTPSATASYPTGNNNNNNTISIAVPLSLVLSVALPECIRTRGNDPRSFYSMCERIVAAESCSFAAMILMEIRPKLERLTLVCSGGEQEGIVSAPSVCDAYIARYQQAVQQLQTLVYRSMCPQLVQSEGVLAKMCDSSRCRWDAKQLRQTPHEWVFDLIDSCRETWSYLRMQSTVGAGTGITVTDAVQGQIWSALCHAAFDTALEGFARARRCSPEGRAAMLMDIAELHKGLQEVHDNTFTTSTTTTTPPSVAASLSSDLPDQTNPTTPDSPSADAHAINSPVSPSPTGPLSSTPRPSSSTSAGAVVRACRECVGKKT